MFMQVLKSQISRSYSLLLYGILASNIFQFSVLKYLEEFNLEAYKDLVLISRYNMLFIAILGMGMSTSLAYFYQEKTNTRIFDKMLGLWCLVVISIILILICLKHTQADWMNKRLYASRDLWTQQVYYSLGSFLVFFSFSLTRIKENFLPYEKIKLLVYFLPASVTLLVFNDLGTFAFVIFLSGILLATKVISKFRPVVVLNIEVLYGFLKVNLNRMLGDILQPLMPILVVMGFLTSSGGVNNAVNVSMSFTAVSAGLLFFQPVSSMLLIRSRSITKIFSYRVLHYVLLAIALCVISIGLVLKVFAIIFEFTLDMQSTFWYIIYGISLLTFSSVKGFLDGRTKFPYGLLLNSTALGVYFLGSSLDFFVENAKVILLVVSNMAALLLVLLAYSFVDKRVIQI